ncbi:serine/threonine-protein kinase [Conexibacter sp. SYSU D00693]|uniref:serine/threonine-protein kinase n=1 Tax=Conexibacter sp. SYSU D00693 TaxID=2812560 RepID=UPI00196AE797|nr:serine/threonine-protein kinase [Conexibacter sp. SYSU D00693]
MSDLPLLSGDLLPGAKVAGYVIEGVVGRGGMGTVYRARDPRLDRVVALKVVAAAIAQDAEFRERFLREARSAAAIEHPNIVPVHEVGEHHGLPFLAMRYLDGPDLREVLAVSGPLEPERVGQVALQLASALDVAHARGLVHRDVKPANVLLPLDEVHDAGHVYLTDFGVARGAAATTLTDGGDLVGTLAYVAPEVISGQPATPASDRYSLACTLFHLLCGRPPFKADSDAGLLWAHMEQEPPAPSAMVPELPRAVDAAMAHALAKDPAARPPTCTAFAEALSAALDGVVLDPGDGADAGGERTTILPAGVGSLSTLVQRAPAPAGPGDADGTRTDGAAGGVRRRALLVGAAVVVGLGAGVGGGLLVAGGDEELPATSVLRAQSGAAEVALEGWRGAPAGAGQLPGLDMTARWSGETLVRGRRVVATVGRLAPAPGTGARQPLSADAERALLGGGRARVLEIGGLAAVEVAGPLASDGAGAASVVVRGSDRGLVAASCRAPDEGTASSACRQLAAALRAPAGRRFLALGADPDAARRLSSALRVATGRRADRSALAGRDAAARAAAARRLAARRDRAARAVRAVQLPRPAGTAVRRLASALEATAAALREAARGGADAGRRLDRAERELREARRALEAHGYR